MCCADREMNEGRRRRPRGGRRLRGSRVTAGAPAETGSGKRKLSAARLFTPTPAGAFARARRAAELSSRIIKVICTTV